MPDDSNAPATAPPAPRRRRVVTLKRVLLGLVVIVAAVVVIVAVQPAEFRVVQSAAMSAPAQVVFAQANDFHNWQAWSPWAKRDPAMKQTFEGAPAGSGAVYTWSGNRDVGEGRMTITESRPSELVRIRLEFLKPFAATNTAEFTFKPQGDQTLVTWSMAGRNGFVGKAIGLLMNMDKLVGGDFEKGLAQMKSIVESQEQR